MTQYPPSKFAYSYPSALKPLSAMAATLAKNTLRACVRACERASVRACERASERACVRASERASERASVRACERASVRACVRTYVRGARACVGGTSVWTGVPIRQVVQ